MKNFEKKKITENVSVVVTKCVGVLPKDRHKVGDIHTWEKVRKTGLFPWRRIDENGEAWYTEEWILNDCSKFEILEMR